MNSLMAAAGLIFAAAATPGPNNLIVMRVAATKGIGSAVPAVAAIVLGSVGLLGLVIAGGGVMFERYPALRAVVTACGALYLGALGLRIALTASRATAGGARNRAGLPDGPLRVFAFQFLNPKGWVMVLTAVSAVQADMSAAAAFGSLAVLFVAITSACLLSWSLCGALLAGWLARPEFKVWFDRVLGGLLATCSLLLFL